LRVNASLAVFNRKSNFAVVRFFNIDYMYLDSIPKELRARTNFIKEFYNGCKAAFLAERSHCIIFKGCVQQFLETRDNLSRLRY